MSSDISNPEKSAWDKWWIKLHQKTSHKTRVTILTDIFSNLIGNQRPLKCLDVGCGDMQIAERLESKLPNTSWTCIDIYPLPKELMSNYKWKKYKSFDGFQIPFESNSYDIILLSDVLHHSKNSEDLLKECARVGKKIIIKDHYQYGFYSNLILKWMDRFGNQAYGVHIPGKYFSPESFLKLCQSCGLQISQQKIGIRLYDHLPIIKLFLRSSWQFWAELEKLPENPSEK